MNKQWDQLMVQTEPPAPTDHDARVTARTNDESTAGALHFHELVSILRRRSRLILWITLCGAMVVFVAALLMPPKYTAKAQVAIDAPSSGPQAVGLPREVGIIETHVTILLSRDHLQHVVDNLLADPDFQLSSPTPAIPRTEAESVVNRAPRSTAARWLPGPSELSRRLRIWIGRFSSGGGTTLNVDQLQRRLTVNQEGRSRIIAVSYTATDPDTATIVANRVAELYIQREVEQSHTYASDELARLDNRIAELKIDVERSSAAVQTVMRQRSDAAKSASEGRDVDQKLQQLERQAVEKGRLYHALLRRQQETRDQQETIAPDAYILSLAATPERPSSPNPFMFVLPALIMFLICGSLLAVILERLDPRLRSEHEIGEWLGIPCIGLVPQVAETDEMRRTHQHLLTNPFAAYAEALRSIVATMRLASPLHLPRVILITSSLPGDGKTTLAVSLSAYIARLQQRVLLIDLDFKQPSIQRELGGKADRGVLDVLLNNTLPAEVIQHVPELGLDYLPTSRCFIDPLIPLAGEEMPRLLNELRASYDCVIIDSSSVLGSTETRLLAALADEVLFVVKWGSTRRETAQNALNLLRSCGGLPAKRQSVSALIAQVDLKKHVRYGYGDAGKYFLDYEECSSGSNRARSANTLRGSYPDLVKSSIAGQYRLAIFRIRLLQLRISASLSDAWRHVRRPHSNPAAGVDDPGQSSIQASR